MNIYASSLYDHQSFERDVQWSRSDRDNHPSKRIDEEAEDKRSLPHQLEGPRRRQKRQGDEFAQVTQLRREIRFCFPFFGFFKFLFLILCFENVRKS